MGLLLGDLRSTKYARIRRPESEGEGCSRRNNGDQRQDSEIHEEHHRVALYKRRRYDDLCGLLDDHQIVHDEHWLVLKIDIDRGCD